MEEAMASDRSWLEIITWAVVSAASNLLYPGLGIIISTVVVFTRLKESRTSIRIGLVALNVLIVALQILGLAAGSSSVEIGPAEPA